jgi:hypothetical protein
MNSTMKKSVLRLVALAVTLVVPVVVAPIWAQDQNEIFYAESFRQGATQVKEESLTVKLDGQSGIYKERIKDLRGNDRYALTIIPQGPEGDDKITSWQVKLADLHHAIYDNILLASQEPGPDPRNNLWWLDPKKFSAVPIKARRIIKVDNFYVSMQVTAYHFTPGDSPYLDSMSVEVKFTNTDPRSEKASR